MRKNDLIKLLEGIKGNPEVVLWNGHVGDFMHIGKLSEDFLNKYSKRFYSQLIKTEDPQRSDEEIEKLYRSLEYEYNQFIAEEDCKGSDPMYKKKRIIFIDAKPRGINTFDRLGEISY